ncbi:MAG: DUF2800 domain-containing protein [Methylococcaceae bacterium]
MTAHARLSASACHKWINCHGAIALEEQVLAENPNANRSSKYAEEGTAAHELAEKTLKLKDPKPEDVYLFVGQKAENGYEFTRAMCDYIKTYVTDFLRYAAGNYSFIEQTVDYSHALQAENWEHTPNLVTKDGAIGGPCNSSLIRTTAFGTGDGLVVTADGTELQVHDLKFGKSQKGIVFALHNEQLMNYAIGALEEYNTLGMIQRVRLVIHQPRLFHLDEWVCSLEELEVFREKMARAAERSIAIADGHVEPELSDFMPDSKTCRWCKGKKRCPAMGNFTAGKIGVTFEDMSEPAKLEEATMKLKTLSNEELAGLMPVLDLIVDWTKEVRACVEGELIAGNVVPNYKLVRGKKGNRAWIDEIEAEATMKSMRLKLDEMYDQSLKTPTKLEKLLKEEKPRKWDRIKALITQAEGKPSVAHKDDKRPALDMAPKFEDMSNNINDLI